VKQAKWSKQAKLKQAKRSTTDRNDNGTTATGRNVMKRLALVIATLALAGPAAADSAAVALDDRQLDGVAAGCGGHGTPTGTSTGASPITNTNINVSPIIVNQTALAFNNQQAKAGKHGKVHQNGTAVAFNTVKINYHPKF
jgi:hypothetical protein